MGRIEVDTVGRSIEVHWRSVPAGYINWSRAWSQLNADLCVGTTTHRRPYPEWGRSVTDYPLSDVHVATIPEPTIVPSRRISL